MVLTVVVVDLMISSNSRRLPEHLKTEFSKYLDGNMFVEQKSFLGCEIWRSDQVISITQGRNIYQLLKKHGRDVLDSKSTPYSLILAIKLRKKDNSGSHPAITLRISAKLPNFSTLTY